MSFTLLRARPGRILAKVWKTDGSIAPAADAAWYEAHELPIGSLSDILAVFQRIARMSRVALVKEAIAPDADPKQMRRRCAPGTDKRTGNAYPQGLCVVARDWLVVDVDGLPRPSSIDWKDGDGLAAYARSLLPGEFQKAACVWQLSGSSGHPSKRGEIRLHLIFMLNQPAFPKAWVPTFAHLPFVDQSIFDNAKLIFTAAPVIETGCDPIPQRYGLLDGEQIVHVSDHVLACNSEIARGDNSTKTIVAITRAPMPRAADTVVDIIAKSNVLRSQHPSYRGERSRRLAFCKMLRQSFGIQDEQMLHDAFVEACVGPDDPNGSHDAEQALAWAQVAAPNGRAFSIRKLLCDASAALHEAGDTHLGSQAAKLATVFAKIEARGATT